MRKFLLLMIALLAGGVSGAWATSTYFVGGRSSSITTGKQYMIYNTARRYFLSASGAAYGLTNNTTPLTFTSTDANYIWTLEDGSASGTYKIKNVGTSTYGAGTSLVAAGSAVDYTIAEYSTCPSKGSMASYNDDGTQTAAASITSADKAVFIKNTSSSQYFNGSGDAFAETGAAHVYVLYEVIELVDGGCYTIDFVSKDLSKYWALSSSTGTVSIEAQATLAQGSVFVAHSFTNSSGNTRWIFVNNSDGYFLSYKEASQDYDISANPYNDFEVGHINNTQSYVSADADCTNKLYITSDGRKSGYTGTRGCYILKESTNAFDAITSPFYNGTYTSALIFTPSATPKSDVATKAIAKADALNEVKDYLTYAGKISALFASPSTIQADINGAATAEAAATVATNFMKSPEGKKFYAVNKNATGQYLNIAASNVTATSTKLYAEAVMEVEYAGGGRYYLKGVKSTKYAQTPNTSANIATSDKASAETFYIVNKGSTDNEVYFSNKKTSGNYGAIHYSSGYTYKCVGWTWDSDPSQWEITAVSDAEYDDLCNVCDVTYNVILAASGAVKASETQTEVQGGTLTIPSSIAKDFCNYSFYTDAACTSAVTVAPASSEATIYALVSEVTTPFTASADYASATWYNMRLKNDAYPLYDSGSASNVTLPNSPGTENNTEWAFIGNPYDGYQIINKGAGNGYELSSEDDDKGTTGSDSYAKMTANDTETYNRWFPRISTHYTNGFYLYNSNNHALNKRSNDNLAYWTGGADAGSTFTVYSVTDNATELTDIADALDDFTYGSAFGEYSLSGAYSGYRESMSSSIIPELKGSYTYANLLVARELYDATYINVPNAGSFVRIKTSPSHISTQTYLTSQNLLVGSYYNCAFTQESSKISGKETIFYYDGTSMLGYSTGLWLKNNGGFAEWYTEPSATGTSVAFMEASNGAVGKYNVKFNNARYLFTRSDANGIYSDAAGTASEEGYNFVLEAVSSLPVTISAAGYATLYAPVALTIPTGVTAYKAADNGTYLTLTAIGTGSGTIPANTGVILAGEAGTYNFNITTGGSVEGNVLAGTTAAISRPANSYVLSGGSSGVGFYKDGATTIPGFKAYLAGAGVKGFVGFNFDETVVRETKAEKKVFKGTVYDLSGNPVPNPKRGIYVMDGETIFIP